MKWHSGLSPNPKPQSHGLSSFYPSKVFKNVILVVSLFFWHPTTVPYVVDCYIYIIYMCTVYPCLVSHLQIFGLTTPSPFLSGRNICMICVFSRYYPEFKMFGTHPIIMLLVCVCVSHYYHHNGWYSVWTIPHYYLLYCWLNWYCIMFILIIITKHTHYIHIYIYTYIYIHIYENTYVYNGMLT